MSELGDSSFYNQVHRLISASVSESSERRGKERRGYRCVQRLAPLSGDNMPGLSQFCDVECHDLSAGGFSFVATEPPDCETLAVELGKAPVLIYVTARIVHISEIWSGAETRFLIGCRFTGRLDPSQDGVPSDASPN